VVAAEHYGWDAFRTAFSVVLAHCTYLPTAECFALLPLGGLIRRTPASNGCDFDYDISRQAVTLVTSQPFRCGPMADWSSACATRVDGRTSSRAAALVLVLMIWHGCLEYWPQVHSPHTRHASADLVAAPLRRSLC
jgi:hypothetical protein